MPYKQEVAGSSPAPPTSPQSQTPPPAASGVAAGVSGSQATPKAAWRDEARRLAATGLTQREIARRLAKTQSRVSYALNPDRERQENASRRAAKREWDRTAKARAGRRVLVHERYRKPCADCGAPMGAGSLHDHDHERCVACERKRRAAAHAVLLNMVESMWNDAGLTGAEIAKALGRRHPNGASTELGELRRQGRLTPRRSSRKLPHRPAPSMGWAPASNHPTREDTSCQAP